MKKIAASLFLFISMAVMALPASADTYTVDFTGVGGQSTDGVYVYPYNFTITNNTTLAQQVGVPMMCIDFTRDITQPEIWQANLVNITTPVAGDIPPFTATQFEELAVLDTEITNTANAQEISDLQFAAWTLTAGSNPANGPYGAGFTAQAATDLQNAVNAVNNTTTGTTIATDNGVKTVTYADYSYFDPTTWPQNDGDPQRFIVETTTSLTNPHVLPGPVPEPSSLMLLGTGVLGLASVARRRFKA